MKVNSYEFILIRKNCKIVTSMAVTKIASDTLDFILASCKASHPREFGALLEADGDTVINVIYLPGTDSTSRSVSLKTWMMPNMPHAGSVHSHPSGAVRPSEQDLIFFRTNEVNIIVGEPYTRESWKAFDKNGNLTTLDVVDYEFDDTEFEETEFEEIEFDD
ncbi:hypothetical protein MmiAt1_05750 [Methanimicrococcus sp. At1]|uniref:MPN domain-containing protein n=1 Tax=Methanimicrococcus hacksteinii TaxID=3028293 RepID=A0ABU3VNN7_9EURY|nr:Mov34/MPN/PAD-1 family protein [Methanimicrococcus sp. At1]MDV0445021.1 hypothetical protein [Methanimicrococcus sp. At1]